MSTHSFFAILVLPAAVAVAGPTRADPASSRATEPTASVVPTIRFSDAAKIDIPLVFRNDSQAPIRYLMRWFDGSGVGPLQFSLYKDGQQQRRVLLFRAPPAEKSHVRTLDPGKWVVDRAQITEFYGKLRAGTYEMRVRYEEPAHASHVKELGLTPMSFRRTIAYLQIEGPAEAVEQRPGGNEERNAPARSAEAQDAPVAVAPVLRFPADASIVVSMVFENTSKEPIHYLMRWPDVNGVTDLQFSLYKSGERQRRVVVIEPPRAEKGFVRTLEPGKRIVDRAQVSRCYGKLQPGLYELRVRYEVRPNTWLTKELGLTPMSFQRTIAFLEIE